MVYNFEMAEALRQWVRGLSSGEFGKLDAWESGVLEFEGLGAAGEVGAAFAGREALKDAVRKRARGQPDFSPLPIGAAGGGIRTGGPGAPRISPEDIPEILRPQPGTVRQRKPGAEPELELPPLEDVDIGREAPGSRRPPAIPDPTIRERAAAGARAVGERISAGARAAGEAAGNVQDVVNRLRNARNAAIIGTGAVTAVIGGILGAGGIVKEILPDGTVIGSLPGVDQDIRVPTRTPSHAPVIPLRGITDATPMGLPLPPLPSGFGTGMPSAAPVIPPRGITEAPRYRTPRHGRWDGVKFGIAARQAAANTGVITGTVKPMGNGLNAARQLAAQQEKRRMHLVEPVAAGGLV
jgi:hypothetical protein